MPTLIISIIMWVVNKIQRHSFTKASAISCSFKESDSYHYQNWILHLYTNFHVIHPVIKPTLPTMQLIFQHPFHSSSGLMSCIWDNRDDITMTSSGLFSHTWQAAVALTGWVILSLTSNVRLIEVNFILSRFRFQNQH